MSENNLLSSNFLAGTHTVFNRIGCLEQCNSELVIKSLLYYPEMGRRNGRLGNNDHAHFSLALDPFRPDRLGKYHLKFKN